MSETLQDSHTRRVDASIAEYLEAIETGSPPDLDAFLAEHDDVAAELREFIADYQALEQASPRRASGDGPDSLLARCAAKANFAALRLPCRFGHFELLEEIARGGMGVVYKARQHTPQRIVALKVILAGRLASRADVDRFYAEAQAAATLDHPNIVPIFEVGEVEGQLYFTMGYVAGQSMAQRLAIGPLPPAEAAAIIRDAAAAVHYAHQQGIIHRDLKPANILLDSAGRARVTDFGLAKRQADEAGLTCTGQLLGTPSFMPPEQIAGLSADVGAASDVYSLGATLYALLTGRPPFHAASVADTLRQVAEQDPLPLRELDVAIPRDLETIALKCLEKSPSRRYGTAQALADDLDRFLADQPIAARRATRLERLLRWSRRNRSTSALTAAVATLLIAAVAILGVSNAQIRQQSEARAKALEQKDAALLTAREAVDQMLIEVANKKFSNMPVGHPLRVALLTDALRFYEGLAQLAENDQALAPEMATALHSMSNLQRELGQGAEAARSLRRALALLRSAENAESPAMLERIAQLELVLAYTMGESLHSKRAEDPAVEAQYRRALALLQELEQRAPERRQPYVICLRYLAERAFNRGEHGEAERLWREAIDRGEAYLAQQPGDVDTRVSLCWACIEFYNRMLRDGSQRRDETDALLQTASHHVELALAKNPKESQTRDVDASVKLSLGTHYCRISRADEAIPLYQQALNTQQSLCGDFPWAANFWGTLQWFHDDIARNLSEQGRHDELRRLLRDSAVWLTTIAPKLPAEPGPQKLLRQTRNHLAGRLRAAGLPDDADQLASSAN
jgi:serine/threonine protein kinase